MVDVRLGKIICLDETNDGGNSDEIYCLIFGGHIFQDAVNIPAVNIPSLGINIPAVNLPAQGRGLMHYFGKWGDFDAGEKRYTLDIANDEIVDLMRRYGKEGLLKLPIINEAGQAGNSSDDYFIIVALMESDNSSRSVILSSLDILPGIFISLVIGGGLSHDQIVDILIRDMRSAIEVSREFPISNDDTWNADDILGIKELRISDSDFQKLTNGESFRRSLNFNTGGYQYILYFDLEP